MAVTFTRVQEGNKIILTFLRETGQTLSTFTRCIFEKLLFYREHHFLFYETHFFIETYPFFLKLLHFFWQFHQKKRRFFVLKHEFLVSFCKKMRFQFISFLHFMKPPKFQYFSQHFRETTKNLKIINETRSQKKSE